MERGKGKATTIVLYAVFVFYACFVLWNILFKYCSPFQIFDSGRVMYRSVNMVPFDQILNIGAARDLNIYGNILLFVPFGVYLQIFFVKQKIWKGILTGAGVSVALEIIQLIFGLGATDIDDVILNTAGAIVGILAYKVLFFIFHKNASHVRSFVAWGSAAVCVAVSGLLILLFVYN